VRGRERRGDLRRHVEGFGEAHALARESSPERHALDELRGDERDGALPDLVDGQDVRVVERGGGARLALEEADALFIPRRAGVQQLDGDRAIELRIVVFLVKRRS